MKKFIIWNWKWHNQIWFALIISFVLWVIFISFDFSTFINLNGKKFTLFGNQENGRENDNCSGIYIYIHQDFHSEFNIDLLEKCKFLNKFINMCYFTKNYGFGPKIKNSEKKGLLKENWYETNQFSLEVIFHNKMKNYKCLTKNSSMASAIYVPYYAGLDVGQYLWGSNISTRDSPPKQMVKWVSKKPEWERMWGRDHFMVGGRISWDFRRKSDDELDWGNKLMFLPESKNMTMLSIEASIWTNEIAIPYPSYFHPYLETQIFQWQNVVRTSKRKYLFSFVGAPRRNMEGSIRGGIIEQCKKSKRLCKFLVCKYGENKCDNASIVMKIFKNSVFCLQPPGDSFTRRSIFDSILGGCIPVFFHPSSAYKQYVWYFPTNYTKYSVYIRGVDIKKGKVELKERLKQVSQKEMVEMREEIIRIIPRVIYGNPNSRLGEFEDAFDIAIKGILQRVENVRRKIGEGIDPGIGFADEISSMWDSEIR